MPLERPEPLVADPFTELQFLDPEEASPYLKFLMYGQPGSGKTRLAGTAEFDDRTAPVLFIDVEGGVRSISRTAMHIRPGQKRRVKVVRAQHLADIETYFDFVANDRVAPGLEEPFKCVVIDSLTELQKLAMKDLMLAVHEANPSRRVDQPQRQDWGTNIEHIRTLVRAFRDLPIHVIMTAHEKEEKDEASGEVLTVSPSLPGKLAGEAAGLFDIVGRLHVTTEVARDEDGNRVRDADGQAVKVAIRHLLVTETERYIAKDRSDSLGYEVINPTIPGMLQKILGEAE